MSFIISETSIFDTKVSKPNKTVLKNISIRFHKGRSLYTQYSHSNPRPYPTLYPSATLTPFPLPVQALHLIWCREFRHVHHFQLSFNTSNRIPSVQQQLQHILNSTLTYLKLILYPVRAPVLKMKPYIFCLVDLQLHFCTSLHDFNSIMCLRLSSRQDVETAVYCLTLYRKKSMIQGSVFNKQHIFEVGPEFQIKTIISIIDFIGL